MTLFLGRLRQPVCFVAHNGNGFDYPLLNAELKRAKSEIPGGILCVDSLEAIRSLDAQSVYEKELSVSLKMETENNTTPTGHDLQPEHACNDKEDRINLKRKVDQDHIDATHVRKRLFTDGDQIESQGENKVQQQDSNSSAEQTVSASQEYTSLVTKQSDVLEAECSNTDTTEEKTNDIQSKSDDSQKTQPYWDTSGGSASLHQVQGQHNEKEAGHLSLLDSQCSITDDVLMEAVNCVDADENTTADNVPVPASTQSRKPQIPVSDTGCSVVMGNSLVTTGTLNKNINGSSNSASQVSSKGTIIADIAVGPLCTPVKSGINNNNATPAGTSTQNTPTRNILVPIVHQGQTILIAPPKQSYKLENIYFRMFNKKPPISHTAEDDCVTLMKVIQKRCPEFLDWVGVYAVPLSNLPPM